MNMNFTYEVIALGRYKTQFLYAKDVKASCLDSESVRPRAHHLQPRNKELYAKIRAYG